MSRLILLKKTRLLKFTAVFMSFIFLSTSVVFAGPVNTHSLGMPENAKLILKTERISDLFILESYGSIIKKWEPETVENNKSVIIIQDAHCNYEVQHNIAKILETLVRDYKIDLVAIEGAAGDIDLNRFGELEDTKTKEKVTDIFVKEGIVTGPEYLRITKYNEVPFGLYGIEDGKLYVKNFISFRDSISNSKETQFFIDELSNIVTRLKEKIYSNELLEFDNKMGSYNNNEISLTDYIKELYKRKDIDSKKYPDICMVYRSIRLEEGIDFKKVEREREQLIRDIEKKLPKEELEEFVKKCLLFKLGKVSSIEYYSYLEKYLNQSRQSNLRRYIHLTKIQAKIDSDGLFRDIQDIANEIKESLFKNNIERSLDNLSKKVDILNKLFKLQLTRGDLEYFKNHKDEFSASALLSLIKIQAPLNNIQLNPIFNNGEFLEKIDNYIIPSDRFYEEALLRDEALVKNTLEKMGEEDKDIAIMITGGFHTEGITRLIQAKGMGYIVISPKITKIQENNPYLSLMMDERLLPSDKNIPQNMLSVPELLADTNRLRKFLNGLDSVGNEFADRLIGLIQNRQGGVISEKEFIEQLSKVISDEIKRQEDSGKPNETYIRILRAIESSILGNRSPAISSKGKDGRPHYGENGLNKTIKRALVKKARDQGKAEGEDADLDFEVTINGRSYRVFLVDTDESHAQRRGNNLYISKQEFEEKGLAAIAHEAIEKEEVMRLVRKKAGGSLSDQEVVDWLDKNPGKARRIHNKAHRIARKKESKVKVKIRPHSRSIIEEFRDILSRIGSSCVIIGELEVGNRISINNDGGRIEGILSRPQKFYRDIAMLINIEYFLLTTDEGEEYLLSINLDDGKVEIEKRAETKPGSPFSAYMDRYDKFTEGRLFFIVNRDILERLGNYSFLKDLTQEQIYVVAIILLSNKYISNKNLTKALRSIGFLKRRQVRRLVEEDQKFLMTKTNREKIELFNKNLDKERNEIDELRRSLEKTNMEESDRRRIQERLSILERMVSLRTALLNNMDTDGRTYIKKWLDSENLESRLSLAEKLMLIERFAKSMDEDIIEAKLSAARVHFKDVYGIDLVLKIGEGKDGEYNMIPVEERARLINALIVIDAYFSQLGHIIKDNVHFRKLIIPHSGVMLSSGAASASPLDESITITLNNILTRYDDVQKTVNHELMHLVLTDTSCDPRLINSFYFLDFLRKYSKRYPQLKLLNIDPSEPLNPYIMAQLLPLMLQVLYFERVEKLFSLIRRKLSDFNIDRLRNTLRALIIQKFREEGINYEDYDLEKTMIEFIMNYFYCYDEKSFIENLTRVYKNENVLKAVFKFLNEKIPNKDKLSELAKRVFPPRLFGEVYSATEPNEFIAEWIGFATTDPERWSKFDEEMFDFIKIFTGDLTRRPIDTSLLEQYGHIENNTNSSDPLRDEPRTVEGIVIPPLTMPAVDFGNLEILTTMSVGVSQGKHDLSPDMRRGTADIEHSTENKWIEERHLNGDTLFIKDEKVYEIVFAELGKPRLDENGNYVLREVTDNKYNDLTQRWTELWDILLRGTLIYNLLDELGITDNAEREYIKGELIKKGLTLVIVKGHAGLGILGDIFSHAGRGRIQITLGEYLLEQLMQENDENVQKVMLEELKHIVRDIYNQNKGLDRSTGQRHVATLTEQQKGDGIYHDPDTTQMLDNAERKAKIHVLAEMLGLQADQINKILDTDKYGLVQILINLIKADGEVTQNEIQIISEQARVVEEVFKKVDIREESLVSEEIKEKIAIFLAIRALEKAERPEKPEFVNKLIKALEGKASSIGIDKDFIEDVINHLYDEVDGFEEEGGALHPTRYFMSFIELIKKTFGVTGSDPINNVIQELITYKYVQAVTKKAFAIKGDEKPIASRDIDEIINRYVHDRDERYKVNIANVLALYLLNPDNFRISRESITSIDKLKNRKGLSGRDWNKDASDAINRNIVDEREINREARSERVRFLTNAKVLKIKKDEVITAYNNYGEKIRNELGLEEEFDLEVANATFAYDVTTIFGSLEARQDGQFNLYDINTLSLTMMNLIAKVQNTKRFGNMNLFVTEGELSDGQKEVLIELLKRHGITDITKDQFVSVEGYEIKAHERGNKVVGMLGESLNNRLKDKKAHKEGDRVLLANQSENDFMLLANMAIVAASTKELEGENGMKARFRQLFRAYYKGSVGEDEIEEWISKIDIVNGIIQILLPPISPFVKAYYDTLKGARELIQQAA